MKNMMRNGVAALAGIVIGSFVNMGLIMISGSIIAPPEGVDPSNMESLKEGMHLFGARHFVFPFLAHALGTFVGAFLCGLFAATHKLKVAMVIGLFFLIGGIVNVMMLPSPLWFTILDICVAYLPMAWLAGKLAGRLSK